MTISLLPKFKNLPKNFPLEGVISIEIIEEIPIFRASFITKSRIEELLDKQEKISLSLEEEQELDFYEEIDDYLSFVNRTIRNLAVEQNQLQA